MANAERYANRSTLRPLKDLQLIEAVRPWLRGKDGGLCRRETHILTPDGAALVQNHFDEESKGQQLRWNASFAEIDGTNQAHAETLVDVYIAFKRAVQPPFMLWGWKDDRELARLAREKATTFQSGVPDAVFVLTRTVGGARVHTPLFVEVDRATETVRATDGRRRDWMGKIERYEQYFSGPFFRDPLFRGIEQEPRVLTITKSERRMANLIEATASVTRSDRYLFTTLDNVMYRHPDAVLASAIWSAPSDPKPQSLLSLTCLQ